MSRRDHRGAGGEGHGWQCKSSYDEMLFRKSGVNEQAAGGTAHALLCDSAFSETRPRVWGLHT